MTENTCPAALNIKGEHFPCQQMDQMAAGSEGHAGWAHSNRDAEAIWIDNPDALRAARTVAEASGR